MTLCLAWRSKGQVTFASDSRLTFNKGNYSDVGIKVTSIPYKITRNKVTIVEGQLGLCFAKSALNSYILKEAISDVIKELQITGDQIPTMAILAEFIFQAYKSISFQLCQAMGEAGRASILIGGRCFSTGEVEVYSFETNIDNQYSLKVVLDDDPSIYAMGSGKEAVEALIDIHSSHEEFYPALKRVIQDEKIPEVGGHIQSGTFGPNFDFNIVGINNSPDMLAPSVWRGPLDCLQLYSNGIYETSLPFMNPFYKMYFDDSGKPNFMWLSEKP